MTVAPGHVSDTLVYICEFCLVLFGFSLLNVVGFTDTARTPFMKVMWFSAAGFVCSGAAFLIAR